MNLEADLPQELPKRFLQMDDEGYFISEGVRVQDEDFGRSLINSITRHEGGIFLVNSAGTWAILEAFDEPFIAAQVERLEGTQWKILLPYGAEKNFELSTLCLDDWDRFHGRTVEGIPFVFSRKAQAEFFNLVDEFEDEAIVVDGREYTTPYYFKEHSEIDNEKFWSEIYQAEELAPWDLDEAATALPKILPQLKIPKSRVLVLGSGRGHDAAFFAEQGHIVTAVDFSQHAIDEAKKLYGDRTNLNFYQGDLFKLPDNWKGQFDVVFEHTCYCAVSPHRRNELVKIWKNLLSPGGYLLGVFFVMDRPAGPPYGGSEWELKERLKKSFNFLYWTRWKHSKPRRQGRELVVYAQKLRA